MVDTEKNKNFTQSGDEEQLPENVLSVDSVVKKKRFNEKIFREIYYLSFLEAIRISHVIIQVMQQIERKEQEDKENQIYQIELDRYRNSSDAISKSTPISSQHQDKTTQDILDRLSDLISKLNTRIKEINNLIESNKILINKFENELHDIRENFISELKNIHPTQASSEPMRLSISLPQEYKNIRGADRYRGVYTIDQSDYQKLWNDLIVEIGAGKVPFHLIGQKINQLIEQLLQEKIVNNLSFISSDKRNEIAQEMLKTGAAQKGIREIYKEISENINNVEHLISLQNEGCKKEAAIEKIRSEVLLLEREMESKAQALEYVSFLERDVQNNSPASADVLSSLAALEVSLESDTNWTNGLLDQLESTYEIGDDILSQLDDIDLKIDQLADNEDAASVTTEVETLKASIEKLGEEFDDTITNKMSDLHAKEQKEPELESTTPRLR